MSEDITKISIEIESETNLVKSELLELFETYLYTPNDRIIATCDGNKMEAIFEFCTLGDNELTELAAQLNKYETKALTIFRWYDSVGEETFSSFFNQRINTFSCFEDLQSFDDNFELPVISQLESSSKLTNKMKFDYIDSQFYFWLKKPIKDHLKYSPNRKQDIEDWFNRAKLFESLMSISKLGESDKINMFYMAWSIEEKFIFFRNWGGKVDRKKVDDLGDGWDLPEGFEKKWSDLVWAEGLRIYGLSEKKS